MEMSEAQQLIATMDVPSYKADIERSPNILWNIEHLRTRNSTKPGFVPLMNWLIDQAESRHLLKKSALAEHREFLARFDAQATTQAAQSSSPHSAAVSILKGHHEFQKRIEQRPPSEQLNEGLRVHPYQQAVVDRIRASSESAVLNAPARNAVVRSGSPNRGGYNRDRRR